jgi:tetratricopeptide (TPR) repeat protein
MKIKTPGLALALLITAHIVSVAQMSPARDVAQTKTQKGQTDNGDTEQQANAAYAQGRKLADAKQFDAAIERFSTAFQLKPDLLEAREWIGDCYIFTRRYEEAIEIFSKLIELKPNYENAYANLAYIYIDLGQFEKAVEFARKVIAINPTFAAGYENLGVALVHLKMFLRLMMHCGWHLRSIPTPT